MYDVIITDDVIDDVIMVGEQKVNMIWNPLTKPINLIYQSAKSVKKSIFFLFWWVINDIFYKPRNTSEMQEQEVISPTLFYGFICIQQSQYSACDRAKITSQNEIPMKWKWIWQKERNELKKKKIYK